MFYHVSLKLIILDEGKLEDNIYYTITSSSFQGIAGVIRRLEAGQMLWGNTARLANPKWWKGYSIQSNVMLSSRTGVVWEERASWLSKVAISQRLTGYHSVCAEWYIIAFCITCWVFSPIFLCLNCLYLNSWVLWILLFLAFPLSCWGRCGWSRWAGSWVVAGLDQPTTHYLLKKLPSLQEWDYVSENTFKLLQRPHASIYSNIFNSIALIAQKINILTPIVGHHF